MLNSLYIVVAMSLLFFGFVFRIIILTIIYGSFTDVYYYVRSQNNKQQEYFMSVTIILIGVERGKLAH